MPTRNPRRSTPTPGSPTPGSTTPGRAAFGSAAPGNSTPTAIIFVAVAAAFVIVIGGVYLIGKLGGDGSAKPSDSPTSISPAGPDGSGGGAGATGASAGSAGSAGSGGSGGSGGPPVGQPYIVPAGRSPIPQPGEDITKPIVAARLDDRPGDTIGAIPLPDSFPRPSNGNGGNGHHAPPSAAPARTAPSDDTTPSDIVPWGAAHNHMGRVITAQGEVVDTYNTGSVCFLNFDNSRRGFYIIIFKDALGSWSQPPERYFLNKTVRVTGQVKEHKGRAQIQVKNPEQIRVVE